MSNVRLVRLAGVNFRTYDEEPVLLNNLGESTESLISDEPSIIRDSLIIENAKDWQAIAGYREGNIRRLETDTNTNIVKTKCDDGRLAITISGRDSLKVKLANRIFLNMLNMTGKTLTHFISLPLFNIPNVEFFYKKCQNLLSHEIYHQVGKSIGRLHFTVSVHTLASKEEVDFVIRTLEEGLKSARPLPIHLKGLKIIKGTPDDCRVLASLPTKHQELDFLFQPILSALAHRGLTTSLSTLWHCTLFNTRGAKVSTFNARKLLHELSRFDFGETVINEIHLSKFTKSNDEYYEAEHVIKLR